MSGRIPTTSRTKRSALAALFAVWLALPAPSAFALSNQLQDHPSPYLAMHAADPVAWQQWGPAVMERARREKKIVYISSGYFSCHWCHVMQQESYRNPQIAAFLNEHFIPVKIDRELQPALDARLIAFMESTRGMSGWPLNVFVTPEGAPLFGVLYVPPDEFLPTLQRLKTLWAEQPEKLRALAEEALRTQAPKAPAKLSAADARRYAQAAEKEALAQGDIIHGGFGEESKFPLVPQLDFLLARVAQGGDEQVREFLLLTLDQMAANGLHDHIAGGFFRYTVDPAWRTPHFEKMLYDNAQLARVYLRAADVLGRPDYADIAYRTLDFMLSEMRSDEGAFIASLSAVDAQGVEGGYYLWTFDELSRLLTPDELRAYRLAFGMRDAPPFDAGYLPVRSTPLPGIASELGRPVGDVGRLVESAQAKLFAARQKRQLPRDHKLLAGWNGLALSAFARAAAVSGERRHHEAARGVRDYLAKVLWDGRRLRRAVTKGKDLGMAGLEDYAYVAQGFWDWAELTHDPKDYALAAAVLREAWQRFYAPGWRLEERPLIKTAPEPAIADSHMPSPSGVVIVLTLRLTAKDRDVELRKHALAALDRSLASIVEAPFWQVSHIEGLLAARATRSSGRSSANQGDAPSRR